MLFKDCLLLQPEGGCTLYRVKLEGARRAAKETSAQSRQISEAKSEPYWGKSGTLRPEMGTLGWVVLRILETQIPLKL